MKKVFWGFFFIYLNFHLTLNGITLNLLPDFVGYLLLYQAAGTLAGESGRFQKLRPFSVAMAVYTGILWVGELLGVTGENWLGILLDTAALVVSLYISWNVVQAILEMEESRSADLNGRAVRRDWLVLVIAEFVSVGLLLLCRPLLFTTSEVLLISVLLLFVALALVAVIIRFLSSLWKCAKRCEDLPPKDAGLEEL